jgi:transcriptional regulator with XRE-family HTH domain
MPKKTKRKPLSEELREAVERAGLSRYSIWQQTGIDQGTLCKFMAGDRGLSIESIDKLAELLGLHICTADAEPSRPKGRR